ncbi:MAG: DUF1295 domain-containing protein [Deltaproteobacteria bacterium]|nr:DUF1295 domain-containing protein [Deltaproteobacteria bacterium]
MDLFPQHGFSLCGGGCLSLFYLVIHISIPLSKKGALSRLLTWPKKGRTIGKAMGFWTTQLAWWGTILYPFFSPIRTDTYLFYTGIAIYLVGIAFTIKALWTYASSPDDQPIVQGLYQFSRNPIYVAYTFIGYGIGISIGSWILVVLHTIEVIACHFVILDEERYCIERYGPEYQKYQKRVPRYFWKL